MFTAKKFLHTINANFCFEIELLLLLSRLCMNYCLYSYGSYDGSVWRCGIGCYFCIKTEAAEEEERRSQLRPTQVFSSTMMTLSLFAPPSMTRRNAVSCAGLESDADDMIGVVTSDVVNRMVDCCVLLLLRFVFGSKGPLGFTVGTNDLLGNEPFTSHSLVCFSNSGILDLKSPGPTTHQN